MRDIKFRAWDKHNRTWITQPVGFTMSVVDGRFHIFGFDDAFADMYQVKVELQQYTGLKDKNGKEIYEGDIVVVDNEKATVTFTDGKFEALNKNDVSVYYPETRWPDIWEVIGNIYENPELLK